MLWSVTLITQGTARGLVVATGAATEIGRIGGLLAGVEQLTTPLTAQMDHFARWLSVLILLASGLLLAYGTFVLHYDFAGLFMAVVGLSVAAIPEGLPAVMTVTLAVLEVFHLFFIRNVHGTSLTWAAVRATPVVWAVVAAITLAQGAVTYLPPLQAILGTEAVPPGDVLLIIAVGTAFFALVEIEKQIRLGLNGQGPQAKRPI
jgi:magnesium-transporting ATPase (P-type)